MIKRTASQILLNSAVASIRLSILLQYRYVRKKQIDQICAPYINSDKTLDKIKMYGKMFAHIGKKGFAGAYQDISLYRQLSSKPKDQYTSQDWNELTRIYHDFFRLGPLLMIQILPMSGPLFVMYMYTYPGSIPSWFIIDKFHEDYQKRIRVKQQQAMQHFRSKNIKSTDINFNAMSLAQARKLAECLYGYHRDGTQGYNKIFKKDIDYIISEAFSKYLIKRKLKYKFRSDLENWPTLKDKTFDEMIKWKYEQVMGGKALKNYQDILTPEELQIRREYASEQAKMDAEGSHTIIEDKNKDNGNGSNSNSSISGNSNNNTNNTNSKKNTK